MADLAAFVTPAMCAGAVAGAGLVQAAAGLLAVQRFRRSAAPRSSDLPPVTILKPLHGDEPLLEAALQSFCVQDYPRFQIVFGLQSAADPALHVLRRLRARFPALDVHIVIDPTLHGSNRKVANLINMLPSARHDVLVISDSDIHAAPDYLRQVVSTLQQPGVGLVTTLYSGLPAQSAMAAQLGAAQINHAFLPGVLLARDLGRQACLGATIALHRNTLDDVGGLAAVANEVADDAILGQLVNRLGLDVRLAATIPATTVPEERSLALFQHELRWARTTRSLAPVGFALSAIQYPLFWAGLAAILSGFGWGTLLWLALVWAARAGVAEAIDRMLRLPRSISAWLLPWRDCLSVAAIVLSFVGDTVRWRGEILSVARPRFAPVKARFQGVSLP